MYIVQLLVSSGSHVLEIGIFPLMPLLTTINHHLQFCHSSTIVQVFTILPLPRDRLPSIQGYSQSQRCYRFAQEMKSSLGFGSYLFIYYRSNGLLDQVCHRLLGWVCHGLLGLECHIGLLMFVTLYLVCQQDQRYHCSLYTLVLNKGSPTVRIKVD